MQGLAAPFWSVQALRRHPITEHSLGWQAVLAKPAGITVSTSVVLVCQRVGVQ